jgi:hypothetical protein
MRYFTIPRIGRETRAVRRFAAPRIGRETGAMRNFAAPRIGREAGPMRNVGPRNRGESGGCHPYHNRGAYRQANEPAFRKYAHVTAPLIVKSNTV